MARKTVFFTGGGSSGHVTPNLALIKEFQKQDWDIAYIGSYSGIERDIICSKANIQYFPIVCDKLRRYMTWRHLFVLPKVLFGVLQVIGILWRGKPRLVFSKGGFVALPVVLGAWILRIPVYTHESDRSPGLANRLMLPFCQTIFLTFPETQAHIKEGKGIVTGPPLREDFFQADRDKGSQLCCFPENKPVVLVFGGSLGAQILNLTIRSALPKLSSYNIVHICGQGNLDSQLEQELSYRQYEYVKDEFPHLLQFADIVVCRAGSNSIYELLALQKPHILVPLSRKVSRGDQIENAEYFEKKKLSFVIPEEEFSEDRLLKTLELIERDKESYLQRLASYRVGNAVEEIMQYIRNKT